MTDRPVEPYYLRTGRDVMRALFDKGFITPDTSAESMDHLGEYLGGLFQLQCEMAVKTALITRSVREAK